MSWYRSFQAYLRNRRIQARKSAPTSSDWNCSLWGRVYEYSSVEDFESNKVFRPGVHRIPLFAGQPLDLLISGAGLQRKQKNKIPLFFSGAVGDRSETTGPYFSGLSLGTKLAKTVISISDPLFCHNPEVNIGWYTGIPNSGAQEIINRAISAMAVQTENEFLLIGGSAGGFAALRTAALVERTTAFVWNPQTSIVKYAEAGLRPYMEVMFPMTNWNQPDWVENAVQALDETNIQYDINSLPAPKAFCYLQNLSDWHVKSHLAPYIKAHNMKYREDCVYRKEDNQCVLLGDFGQGHSAPPRKLLETSIKYLLQPNSSMAGLMVILFTKGFLDATDFSEIPKDLGSDETI